MARGDLVRAAAAAVVAGVAGAVVWGVVEVQTGYEIGIAAAAIGWLVGSAVLRVSGGRGLPFQAIAIVVSLAAIVLGKYIAFVYALRDAVQAVGGDSGRVTLWSGDVMHAFVDDRSIVFGGFDLLWAAFAIYAAFRILQAPPAPPAAVPPPAA